MMLLPSTSSAFIATLALSNTVAAAVVGRSIVTDVEAVTTVVVYHTVTVEASEAPRSVGFSTTLLQSTAAPKSTIVTSKSSAAVSPTSFVTSTKVTSAAQYVESSSVVAGNETTANTDASSGFLYGVNLGGWLILEKWMNGDVFTGNFANAWDQYSFDSIDGAADALATHWETWFTEATIKELSSHGINALRIPIGFWAYDNANTPYVQGADVYMEKAIGWARTYGMKVWVDCHGSPGSQNGYDNSGHSGSVEWQHYGNLDRSISVLETMAAKYGAASYSDVVVGIELTNEPLAGGNNDFATTQSWSVEAYKAVRAAAANKELIIIMHDAFMTPAVWEATVASANANKLFAIDTHMYQLYTAAENLMNQAQHISEACGWASALNSANAKFPVYAGEWSALSNICAYTDGDTSAGSSCPDAGCQCQNIDLEYWNAPMIKQVRMYVEAQMDVFQASTSGYFMWAAKGPGAWGFLNGVDAGIIPSPVTARKYSAQCGTLAKRAHENVN